MLTTRATFGSLLLCSILLGIINAVDIPTRQAIIVDLVTQPEDAGNAIALNSLMVNGARLIGPSLAGVLIAAVGEGWCFLLNGLSYLAVVAALLAMRLPAHAVSASRMAVLTGVREGVRYTWAYAPIRAILLLLALASLLGMPYQVLMPVFATDILHGDAHTLGVLTAASGVGAIMGALYMASRASVVGLGRVLVVATSLFGLGLLGLAVVRSIAGTVLTLIGASGGMMVLTTASNTILQTLVDDDKRGRVMSLYTMVFMGMTPLGSLLAGSVATHLGAPPVVGCGGVCCLVGALIFARHLPALRALVWPLYVQRGLLPAATLQTQIAIDACLHVHH